MPVAVVIVNIELQHPVHPMNGQHNVCGARCSRPRGKKKRGKGDMRPDSYTSDTAVDGLGGNISGMSPPKLWGLVSHLGGDSGPPIDRGGSWFLLCILF